MLHSPPDLPTRTLLRVAHHMWPRDETRCEAVITLLAASRALRHALERQARPPGLSEHRFTTLVVLFALDPSPTTPADIAYHTGMAWPATTELLEQLHERRWIETTFDEHDGRVAYIGLTDLGRAAADHAIHSLLLAARHCSGDLEPAECATIASACRKLTARADAASPA